MNHILKKNDYKCVTLEQDDSGQHFVTKAYSNQGPEQDRQNAQYISQSLSFFYQNFSNTVRVPELISTDLDNCKISMEYLPDLPTAKRLRLADLPLARDFFQACYQQTSDAGFLRDIADSVIINPDIQVLLNSDFPLTLGFRGDLSENLVLGDNQLILADIDSIGLEPLGLSELILYAERFGSTWLHPAVLSLLAPPPTPVAFAFLNRNQAQNLIEAALAVLSNRMNRVPRLLRNVKYALADKMLRRTLHLHYR